MRRPPAGFQYGGPVTVVWGWVLIVAMTLSVALPMAEICSSLPTTGGVYYWCAPLLANAVMLCRPSFLWGGEVPRCPASTAAASPTLPLAAGCLAGELGPCQATNCREGSKWEKTDSSAAGKVQRPWTFVPTSPAPLPQGRRAGRQARAAHVVDLWVAQSDRAGEPTLCL